MTDNQKRLVIKLRSEGLSYKEISRNSQIPLNTVKSFCKRNAINPENDKETITETNRSDFCRNCGKPIMSIPHHRARKFCSRECGLEWWHEHPEKGNRKAMYQIVCSGCGQTFSSYGNKNRKYCSHQCYINTRFGGSANEIQ